MTAIELDQTIQTFDAASTPKRAKVLGPVTATSCKNKMWDNGVTKEEATAQLRLLSRQQGGNAVGNLTCEGQEATSLALNCWESIVCTVTALKVGDEPARTPTRRR